MIKIAFLGGKDIGVECLKILLDKSINLNLKVEGVFPNGASVIGNKGALEEICRDNELPVYHDLEKLLELDIDYIISVQYNKILRKRHIEKAKIMAVNLHMAPLPEYRGCNQFSFAILDEKKEFGTTLHILDLGVDSGSILAEMRFPISSKIWIDELYKLTHDASIELFKNNLVKLIQGELIPVPQDFLINTRGTSKHRRVEINDIKRINPEWSPEKIHKHIRATSMPGYDPAFLEFKSGERFFLHRVRN